MIDVQKLLRELIALPSVNPAFVLAGDLFSGEHRMTDFIAATAARAGLDLDFQKVLPGRSNLLARLSPLGRAKRRILLAPHLDTVGVVSEKQFAPETRDGRIYGRGACDTKGSVAAMLTVLFRFARSRRRPVSTEIIFAGLIDEENAQSGSRALAGSGLRAELAIVGEPTRAQVVTAHKGSLWLSLETRGRSAHGSRPHLGKNAVHEMARVVDYLETTYRNQLRRRRHSLLGCATASVGTIRGGVQPNVVPAHCEIRVDRRTLPGETEESVRRELAAFLRGRKLSAKISSAKDLPCLPMETDFRLPLARDFLRAAGQRTPAGADYFCDASVLAQAGIPSVVFGPGDIAQAHTADEWISLSSLERAVQILTRFFESLE